MGRKKKFRDLFNRKGSHRDPNLHRLPTSEPSESLNLPPETNLAAYEQQEKGHQRSTSRSWSSSWLSAPTEGPRRPRRRLQKRIPTIETALEQIAPDTAPRTNDNEQPISTLRTLSQSSAFSRHSRFKENIDVAFDDPPVLSPVRSLPPMRSSNHPSVATTGSYFKGKMPLRFYPPLNEWTWSVSGDVLDEHAECEGSVSNQASRDAKLSERRTSDGSPCESKHFTASILDADRNLLRPRRTQSLLRMPKSPNLRALSPGQALSRSSNSCSRMERERQIDHKSPCRPSIKRSHLHKPLPPLPHEGTSWPRQKSVAPEQSSIDLRSDFESSPSDFRIGPHRTHDTTIHQQWAPAVTHETVIRNVHEIREEQIDREIHEHHYQHRILPVEEVEILPVRHIALIDGRYVDVAEDDIPSQVRREIDFEVGARLEETLRNGTMDNLSDELSHCNLVFNHDIDQKVSVNDRSGRAPSHWIYPRRMQHATLGPENNFAVVMSPADSRSGDNCRASQTGLSDIEE